jgi:hypothetical protein
MRKESRRSLEGVGDKVHHAREKQNGTKFIEPGKKGGCDKPSFIKKASGLLKTDTAMD